MHNKVTTEREKYGYGCRERDRNANRKHEDKESKSSAKSQSDVTEDTTFTPDSSHGKRKSKRHRSKDEGSRGSSRQANSHTNSKHRLGSYESLINIIKKDKTLANTKKGDESSSTATVGCDDYTCVSEIDDLDDAGVDAHETPIVHWKLFVVCACCSTMVMVEYHREPQFWFPKPMLYHAPGMILTVCRSCTHDVMGDRLGLDHDDIETKIFSGLHDAELSPKFLEGSAMQRAAEKVAGGPVQVIRGYKSSDRLFIDTVDNILDQTTAVDVVRGINVNGGLDKRSSKFVLNKAPTTFFECQQMWHGVQKGVILDNGRAFYSRILRY